MEDLAEILGLDHHITLPYCPWVNGSVEVVGKDLLWTLRALCNEFNVQRQCGRMGLGDRRDRGCY